MRKALVVGINYYQNISQLYGCANDARDVAQVLERHADDSINFGVKLVLAESSKELVTRSDLKEAIRNLFAGDGEVALLFFAGHGYVEDTGGYLCASDCTTGDDGVPISEILTLANKSRIQNRVIILDSCHSGIAGDHPTHERTAELMDGMTILTASTSEQYASEQNGSGVFTSLLVDALNGAASNLVGDITPGSVYAHVDQSLGPWAQRPMFKTNVKRFIYLRKVHPPLKLTDLRRIIEFFPTPDYRLQLGPEYEPERAASEEEQKLPPPDPVKTAIFSILQQYNRLNLLVPEGVFHMWHAAMQSKTVRLTKLGEHYRRLVEKGLI